MKIESPIIAELEEQILYHTKCYSEGSPEITDAEFDCLINELKKLDPENPVLFEVGVVPSGVAKVEHVIPMGSLNKITFSDDADDLSELKKFYAKHPEDCVSSLKYDGLAGEIVYQHGKLVQASSRGDGRYGTDFTEHVRNIDSIPTILNDDYIAVEYGSFSGKPIHDVTIRVRGEFYINKSFFKKNLEGEYANPRNAVAGAMGCDNPVKAKELGVRFIAYKVFIDDMELSSLTQERDFVNKFLVGYHGVYSERVGFVELNFLRLDKEKIDACAIMRKELDFEIDGLVIAVNDTNSRNDYGMVGLNKKGMVAFKFRPEQAQTTLLDVVWQIGRTGVLTPVASLSPVKLAGSVISRCSLYNLSEIKRLKLMIGSNVLIEKAGDIIPKINRVLETETSVSEIPVIDTCPICGEYLRITEKSVYCDNVVCNAKLASRLVYFLQTVGVKNVGLGKIECLINNGLIKEFIDIYYLSIEDLLKVDGFAESSAESLVQSILDVCDVDLSVFLTAVGISGIGTSNAKDLANGVKTVKRLFECTEKDFSGFGLGPVLSASLPKNLKKMEPLLTSLSNILNIKEPVSHSGCFSGLSFCVSGTLPIRRGRFVELVEKSGGVYKSSISKKLDYFVIGEGAVDKKIEKAKELGVAVLDYDGFLTLRESLVSRDTTPVDYFDVRRFVEKLKDTPSVKIIDYLDLMGK